LPYEIYLVPGVSLKQKKKGSSWFAANAANIILLCIILLGLYLSLGFFYGPSWINGSDDYIYAQAGRAYASGNFTDQGVGTIHIRYLLYSGIGAFVKLMGYGQLSLAMFGVFTFVLTILFVYLIGLRLSGKATGLIAAFLYSIFPLVAIQAPTVGDVVPMTFFLTLAVLLAVEGIESKKSKQRRNPLLAAAGFVSLIGFLVSPEALIGVFFILVMMVIYFAYHRDKPSACALLSYMAGVSIGVGAIALIGLLHTGSAAYLFMGENLASLGLKTPPFSVFMQFLLPNNLISKTLASGVIHAPSIANAVALAREYVDLGPTTEFKFFGLFGYAAVLCLAYLIISKERKAAVPALWFLVTLLYLGFGSQGLSRYSFIVPYARYEVIFAPAIVLIIGMALSKLISHAKRIHGYSGFALVLFVDIVLVAFAVTSIMTIRNFGYSERYGTYPLIEIGAYLDGLPSSVHIIGPSDIPWIIYVNSMHTNTISTGPLIMEETCAEIRNPFGDPIANGTYFVGPSNANFSSCGFREVYSPSHPAGFNSPYDLYWAVNFYNISVYEHVP
jgi:4-amino-4-deoxy-L-arabinose transferase-like glycosyltransferase